MVDAFPTGIDTALFLEMINSTRLKDKVIELQRHFDGKSLVLGIDRMDYVKGIPHKLIALEKFLHAYPAWANRIVLVQIATPPKKDTARYQKLRNKVHKLVGRINGRFGTLEHAPIHYLDQPINIIEVRALSSCHGYAPPPRHDLSACHLLRVCATLRSHIFASISRAPSC